MMTNEQLLHCIERERIRPRSWSIYRPTSMGTLIGMLSHFSIKAAPDMEEADPDCHLPEEPEGSNNEIT